MTLPDLFLGTTFLNQDFDLGDLGVILVLVLLEGLLSLDNALVLGLLAKRLPKEKQRAALTYGLVGAFVFRILAIALASFLLKWTWVKLLGGGYLVFIALKHLFWDAHGDDAPVVSADAEGEPEMVDPATGKPLSRSARELQIQDRLPPPVSAVDQIAGSSDVRDSSPDAAPSSAGAPSPKGGANFWWTVFVIELTDIAFAIDSILAAIAFVGHPPGWNPDTQIHPKLWVVIAGGMLGILLMRIAAVIFIRLLEKFPRFELAAYLLVSVIGGKLLIDWWYNSAHEHVVDFHSPTSPWFWGFWITMLVCLLIGFIPKTRKSPPPQLVEH